MKDTRDTRDPFDRLERERALLADVLRLRWFHWGAMMLSMGLLGLAWLLATDVSRAKEQRRFEHEAGVVADVLAWRMDHVGTMDAPALRALMSGALAPDRRLVDVVVRHGDEVVHDEVPTWRDAGPHGVLRQPLTHGDGTWSLELRSTSRLERRARRYLPDAVLAGGVAIQALLFALIVVQSRSARRTLALASTASALSREVRDRERALTRANEALAAANLELERFACIASHDLKTPLIRLGTQLDLLEVELDEGPSDAAAPRTRLRRMQDQVGRLQRLIDGVLAYSSIAGAGDETPDACRHEAVDVAALVQDIGEALDIAPERLLVSADPPSLHTDATRLGQVLTNLVTNAFKHHDGPQGATVRVTCEPVANAPGALPDAARTVRFHVEDDGPGIAAEDQARVFDLYTRLPPARGAPAHGDGSGVGLSIVRRSVEALGGRVSLASAPGAGSHFSFTWPSTAAPGGRERLAAVPGG